MLVFPPSLCVMTIRPFYQLAKKTLFAGGTEGRIKTNRCTIEHDMRATLTVSLMSANGERVLGYIRGALLKGQRMHPISSLLDLST